jgi:hypothetical protein
MCSAELAVHSADVVISSTLADNGDCLRLRPYATNSCNNGMW